MEMISKLGPLARACFFLSLACARLALRLAQLLCVRPRPAFSASPFASSASRSAKLEDISTDRRPEHEARERGNFSVPRPWLKCWVLLPVAARGEGDAPRPRRPGEAAPSATPGLCRTTTSRRRPLPRKKTGRARARTRRASGASPVRAHGAHPARLPTRIRRVSRRASGASSGAQTGASCDAQTGSSCDAQPARLATRNRRVSRRAEPARLPTRRRARVPARRLARLPARSRHASAACEVFAF